MATRPANPKPPEAPPEPAAAAEPAEEAVPAEQEERIVTQVVDRIKDYISEVVTGGEGQGAEGSGEDSTPTPEPSTPREVEAASEDAVRAAVEKITAEKEHAAEHAKIRETERPPQQFSRLTKALWGDR